MSTQTAGLDPLEQGLVDAVSPERLMADTRAIAQWIRLSGSEEERRAFDYIEEQCRATGAEVKRYAPECLISLPGPATLEITQPERRSIECITHSFAAPTGGQEGEVVWAGRGTAADYAGLDARGKIALTDGLASPDKMVAARAAGVIALINLNDENFHEMIVTPVWGTPVPETADLIPAIPAISVKAPDGEALKQLARSGGLRVRITAEVETGWRPIPCLTAELPGSDPNGRFVMFSGHVDSWHYGAMDNGSANATMLETLRVLARRPGGLRRGIRFAFWSGHSHGRYAGSTWYADTFWRELHDRCVAHVNVDSTGGIGADVLDDANTMAETTGLAREAIRAVAGQELTYRRFGRNGDQSFWGVGLPSVFVGLSHPSATPTAAMAARALRTGAAPRRGGSAWWWHTIHDTIDKIDADNLARDTRVYVLVCNRLCNADVLPLDYAATAVEIRDAIQGYASQVGDRLDLSAAVAAAEALVRETERLNAAIAGAKGAEADRLNRCLMELGRLLVPLNYFAGSPFDQDLALTLPPVPSLAGARELATLDPSSDTYRFLRTKLVRAQNRVVHDLDAAAQVIRATLAAGPVAARS